MYLRTFSAARFLSRYHSLSLLELCILFAHSGLLEKGKCLKTVYLLVSLSLVLHGAIDCAFSAALDQQDAEQEGTAGEDAPLIERAREAGSGPGPGRDVQATGALPLRDKHNIHVQGNSSVAQS